MRDLRELERFRAADSSTPHPSREGWFFVQSVIDSSTLVVVASAGGEGWDHVSVSRKNRCPNWPEMKQIKELFFEDSETVVEYHPAASEYVNCHPFCLHLWRPCDVEMPVPPSILVGPNP